MNITNYLQYQVSMSPHIKNPDALQKLDKKQQRHPLGVLFLLFQLYPLYLVMRLLGMKRLYWSMHRRLYMALHHGENLFLQKSNEPHVFKTETTDNAEGKTPNARVQRAAGGT